MICPYCFNESSLKIDLAPCDVPAKEIEGGWASAWCCSNCERVYNAKDGVVLNKKFYLCEFDEEGIVGIEVWQTRDGAKIREVDLGAIGSWDVEITDDIEQVIQWLRGGK